MTLSQDKQKALQTFNNFMQDSKAQIMLVQGPPGVGKTYFINEMVENFINVTSVTSLIDPKTNLLTSDNVVLAATTHKAKNILIDDVTSKIQPKYNMEFNTATIHSVLGLRMFYNRRMEMDYTIDKNGAPFAFNSNNALLIIDEASYINKKMRMHINDLLSRYPKIKLVYVADKYQGKPVKEDTSLIFGDYDYFAELTARFRFPENGSIHQNSVMLEEAIRTGVNDKFIFDDNFKVIGQKEFIDVVKSEIVAGNSNTKIIAYTNDQVKDYNRQIQLAIYGTERLQVGQKMVNNSAFVTKKVTIPNEKIVTITGIEHTIRHFQEVPHYPVNLSGFNRAFYICTDMAKYKQRLKEAVDTSNWKLFFQLKENFIELYQNWAMTSHKSQGSTFDNVIIDFNNLSQMSQEDFFNMLNVAITRPTTTVYLYRSDLP